MTSKSTGRAKGLTSERVLSGFASVRSNGLCRNPTFKETMVENVVKFTPQLVGDAVRLDADEILEAAKGQKFNRLLIVGDLEDGEIYVAGTANAGESMILMELAKRHIVDG